MEQEVKDWEKYSRQIVLAMSKKDGRTWNDATDACREDELHAAICLKSVERSKEYVVGNIVQDRKHIGN